MPKKPKTKKQSETKKNAKIPKTKVIKWLFVNVVIFLSLVSAYHFYYARRIIPGVHIGNIPIGGLAYTEAKEKLITTYELSSKTLTYLHKHEGAEESEPTQYLIKAEDIELEYLWDNTVSRAFEVGRTGNLWVDTKDKIAGMVKPLRIPAFYNFNEDLLGQRLSTIRAEVVIPAEEAHFVFERGALNIKPSKTGETIDSGSLYDTTLKTLAYVEFSKQWLPLKPDKPEFSGKDLVTVQKKVWATIENPLKVVYEDAEWILGTEDKLALIDFVKKSSGTDLTLNKSNYEGFLDRVGLAVNKQPRGEVLETNGLAVTKFEITQQGERLNVSEFTNVFTEAFFGGDEEVRVPTVKTGILKDISQYGIFAELGEGSSKFYGSSKGRVDNIVLSSERASGVLVPPQGIYSLNEALGPVSGKTGYSTAWIIANGRTILGEGGGVCQTSTTLFRAILNAGLPVIERHPHAYRVSYYENDMPVGFDASVYQPSLDLKFKNDTPNYVLVQASWDLSESSLVFKIYGTPDGREVEISEPVVSNVVAPPEPLYKEDPNLAAGVIEQIDFAAWGANAYFTRVVRRGKEVLYEDVFSSSYRPWQAVFLKGTGK